MMKKFQLLATICFLPGALFFLYFIMRINGIKIPADIEGISSVIRVYFVVFGSSIAYFMAIISVNSEVSGYLRKKYWFWFLSSLVCCLVALDDTFSIHNTVRELHDFGSFPADKMVLVTYGVLLLIVIFWYRKSLSYGFWLCLGVFGILAVVSIYLDNQTYRPRIGGRKWDIEQISETLALFFLGTAFGWQAATDLSAAVRNLVTGGDARRLETKS